MIFCQMSSLKVRQLHPGVGNLVAMLSRKARLNFRRTIASDHSSNDIGETLEYQLNCFRGIAAKDGNYTRTEIAHHLACLVAGYDHIGDPGEDAPATTPITKRQM